MFLERDDCHVTIRSNAYYIVSTKQYLFLLFRRLVPARSREKFLKILGLPIPISIAVTYLYTRYDQTKSYANLVIVHVALKWLHTFIPYGVANALDGPICRNILETAKRSQNIPVNKKKTNNAFNYKRYYRKIQPPTSGL